MAFKLTTTKDYNHLTSQRWQPLIRSEFHDLWYDNPQPTVEGALPIRGARPLTFAKKYETHDTQHHITDISTPRGGSNRNRDSKSCRDRE